MRLSEFLSIADVNQDTLLAVDQHDRLRGGQFTTLGFAKGGQAQQSARRQGSQSPNPVVVFKKEIHGATLNVR